MVRVLVACGACITAAAGPAGPAAAGRQPEVRVGTGRVVAAYAALTGAYENDGAKGPEPTDCDVGGRLSAVCDTIPLRLTPPALGRYDHVVLRILLSWATQGGTDTLDGRLWDGRATYSPVPVAADVSGGPNPVKAGTQPVNGQQMITYVDPPTTQYFLVVDNVLGVNAGYQVAAQLEIVAVPPFSGAPDQVSPRAGRAAATSPTTLGPSPTTSVPAHASFSPDPRFASLVATAGGRTHRGFFARTLPWWLVGVALVALVVVGEMLRRRLGPGFTVTRVSLFWKLLTPFVAIVFVVGVLGTFVTVRYLTSQAQTTLDQSLLQREASAEAYLRDEELYGLEAVQFAANLQGLPEAVAGHDPQATATVLASAAAVRKDLDVISATDLTGHSLVDYTAQLGGTFQVHGQVDWSAVPAVGQVLAGVVDSAGDIRSGLVRVGDGTTLLVVAGPVRTDRLVGVVVAAIDATKLAGGAATRSGSDTALYDGAGQLMGQSPGPPAPGSVPAGLPSAPTRRNETRAGHHDATLYAPLVIRGQAVGTLAVTRPVGSAFTAVRGAALRIGLLVAVAMAAIAALGAFLSRYILRNLRPLLDTNRALGRGELDVRAPVTSGDELGELAIGFNAMAEQLQASYGVLEERVAERTEELRRLYQENVSSAEARAEFFATISHEFRTPLFAIRANAQMLSEPDFQPDDPAEIARQAAAIDRAAGVVLERVNELLDLAKGQTVGVTVTPAAVSVATVWDEMAASVAALGRAREVEVSADLEGVPAVDADPERLRQILLNLASNAVKYTPPGGAVRLTAERDGDAVAISVADTGVGIPAGVGDQVFEPYYQVDGNAAPGGWASTGLGLALTRRLVEAHGGRIWYESAPGHGSTFHFTLPVAQRSRADLRR